MGIANPSGPSARPRAVVNDREFVERHMEERRRLGIDKFDEMWDGELHINPPPLAEHGRIEMDLAAFLGTHVKRNDLGRITRAGVRDPKKGDKQYRTPDLIFVSEALGASFRRIERPDGTGALEVFAEDQRAEI